LSLVTDSSGNVVLDSNGNPVYAAGGNSTSWVEVETDANGNNDLVMLTTLCQVLRLNKNESPFFADWGIYAKGSIMQQVAPDSDMSAIQQQFAPSFASLVISKQPSTPQNPTPTYNVNVITHQGVSLTVQVAS